MLNLDPSKFLLIAVVAILVLGPEKLPGAARQAGAMWRTCSEFRHHLEAQVRSNVPDLPSTTDLARLAHSPLAFLDQVGDPSIDAVPGPEDPAQTLWITAGGSESAPPGAGAMSWVTSDLSPLRPDRETVASPPPPAPPSAPRVDAPSPFVVSDATLN